MNIGFSNIMTDRLNGLLFSLMGMLIVFAGLVLLCIYIFVLPHMLEFVNKRKNKIRDKARVQLRKAKAHYKDPGPRVESITDNDEDIIVAIATALHLEHSFLNDNKKFTWKDEISESHWKVAGKMNGLMGQKTKASW